MTDTITTVFTLLAAIHAVALIIVNWTSTPKDNEWVSKIYRWVELAAGVVTKKAKE